jgi:hypothetical protein
MNLVAWLALLIAVIALALGVWLFQRLQLLALAPGVAPRGSREPKVEVDCIMPGAAADALVPAAAIESPFPLENNNDNVHCTAFLKITQSGPGGDKTVGWGCAGLCGGSSENCTLSWVDTADPERRRHRFGEVPANGAAVEWTCHCPGTEMPGGACAMVVSASWNLGRGWVVTGVRCTGGCGPGKTCKMWKSTNAQERTVHLWCGCS